MLISWISVIMEEVILLSFLSLCLDVKRISFKYVFSLLICGTISVVLEVVGGIKLFWGFVIYLTVLWLLNHKKDLVKIGMVTFILLILLVISEGITLNIVSLMTQVKLTAIKQISSVYLLKVLLTNALYLIMCTLFYIYYRKEDEQFSSRTVRLLIVISFVLFIVFLYSSSMFRYNQVRFIDIEIIMSLLLVFIAFFIFMFFALRLENKKRQLVEEENIRLKYSKRNYDKLRYVYDELEKKEHRMTWVLRKIDLMAENPEISQIIKKEIDDLNKRFFISNTGVKSFDYEMMSCINELMNKGYDIKTVLNIKNNYSLEGSTWIDEVVDYIVKTVNSKELGYVSITINGNHSFVAVNISYRSFSWQQSKYERYSQVFELNS